MMFVDIGLLFCTFGLGISIMFLHRNQQVYAFCKYLNEIVFLNNILAIHKNHQNKQDIYKDLNIGKISSYNKSLYCLKSIKTQYREILEKYPLVTKFSDEDIRLMVSTDDVVNDSIKTSLRNINLYQVRHDL